jgi:hypothetical protein
VGIACHTSILRWLYIKLNYQYCRIRQRIGDAGRGEGVDVPHYQGLSFDEAISVLCVFIASRKLAGLVINQFNADRDAD